uniref:Reverse transcriptase zinc-binding domain-containing protein n=1 Tax=Aegilops tauschii subsp. strangulata TaxID=200361 RepID=A0A453LKF7_AEGTS
MQLDSSGLSPSVWGLWPSQSRRVWHYKRRREDWLEGNAGSSDYEIEAKAWTSLWSVEVPEKIHNFLWRLAKHTIPTEDVRHGRNMAGDDKCQLCGIQDSWRHSLLECSIARCVWALVDDDVAYYIQAS